MNESDRANGAAESSTPNIGARSTNIDPALVDAVPRGIDPAERPGASGHRFGPELACSECGMHWDAHQRAPAPCAKETAGELFLRRPALES